MYDEKCKIDLVFQCIGHNQYSELFGILMEFISNFIYGVIILPYIKLILSNILIGN